MVDTANNTYNARSSNADFIFGILGYVTFGIFAALIYLFYLGIANDPIVPQDLDSTGYFSHKIQTTITAQDSWIVGESKDCMSYPLNAEAARNAGKEQGYAFSNVDCDNGPGHNMLVTFWGSKDQPGKYAALWNCTRTADAFVCKQTAAF